MTQAERNHRDSADGAVSGPVISLTTAHPFVLDTGPNLVDLTVRGRRPLTADTNNPLG